jgi:hypothetical protein
MMITVATVRVMQVPVDQVIDMGAMRHAHVPASRAMAMGVLVSVAIVIRRTLRPIGRRFRDRVLVDRVTDDVVQMAIMEIVDVPVMADSSVSALRSVHVRVVRVRRMRTRCVSCLGRFRLVRRFGSHTCLLDPWTSDVTRSREHTED